MALASVRHVPVYVTVAGPVVAYEMADVVESLEPRRGQEIVAGDLQPDGGGCGAGFRRTSIWPSAVVVGLVLTGAADPLAQGFSRDRFSYRHGP